MEFGQYDKDKVDDTILALLWLTMWDEKPLRPDQPMSGSAWKSFDWEHMDRLHQKGYIFDPKNKAKSVHVTPEGRERAEKLFRELFRVIGEHGRNEL